MDSASLEKFIDLTTKSVKDQQEANNQALINSLDAADRIIMRKAADAAIQIAANPQTDPT